MKSTILTKVNTVTPRNFAQQCEWMSVDKLNTRRFCFFTAVCRMCHKSAALKPMPTASTIDAHSGRGSYRYVIYEKHIVRTDLNTSKKKFYQIS